MSDRDTLYNTLPNSVHPDAEALLEENEQRDLRDIVATLHQQGKLTAGQLKDTILALESQNRITQVARTPPPTLGSPHILGQLGAGAMGEVLLSLIHI